MTLPNSHQLILRSESLTAFIRDEINRSQGTLSFARFMELALYTPELGYYSAIHPKLGPHGDFVTAPEISPLFAKTIAHQFQPILESLPENEILEIGAGSGIFAKDVLLELERLNALPSRYLILDISPDLRERQRALFASTIPHLFDRIQWLDALPIKPITGIIFANEVLDALPVHLFKIDNGTAKERCVTWRDNAFAWQLLPPTSSKLREALDALQYEFHFENQYESEVNLTASTWIQSIANTLQQGMILLFDYGYGRAEYYHPDRSMGTLMCYYQHQRQDNPLIRIGLQDITAHVDFTRIIESADSAGCSLAGYTTQADFLMSCGLLSLAEQAITNNPIQSYKQAQAIKKLIMPSEMGEAIKVMALTKNMNTPLIGFSKSNRCEHL